MSKSVPVALDLHCCVIMVNEVLPKCGYCKLKTITNTYTYKIILVMWLECRYQDTEVDGSKPGISMLCP